ncbi:MAG: hypothetical protein LBE70_03725 [Nitrososphaerota archaeon]|jgi:hypothetical protein|nr:hypothetical protein [Nitrososphaerota archaeon]
MEKYKIMQISAIISAVVGTCFIFFPTFDNAQFEFFVIHYLGITPSLIGFIELCFILAAFILLIAAVTLVILSSELKNQVMGKGIKMMLLSAAVFLATVYLMIFSSSFNLDKISTITLFGYSFSIFGWCIFLLLSLSCYYFACGIMENRRKNKQR